MRHQLDVGCHRLMTCAAHSRQVEACACEGPFFFCVTKGLIPRQIFIFLLFLVAQAISKAFTLILLLALL